MSERFRTRTVVNERWVVSTVRLSCDHGFDGRPLWYETMVFPCDSTGGVLDWGERDMARYRTKKDALKGHKAMVAKWSTRTEEE